MPVLTTLAIIGTVAGGLSAVGSGVKNAISNSNTKRKNDAQLQQNDLEHKINQVNSKLENGKLNDPVSSKGRQFNTNMDKEILSNSNKLQSNQSRIDKMKG